MKNRIWIQILYSLLFLTISLCGMWVLSFRLYHVDESQWYWLISAGFGLLGQFLTGWIVDYVGRSPQFVALGVCLILFGRYVPIPFAFACLIGIGFSLAASGIFVTFRNQTLGNSRTYGTLLGAGLFGAYIGYSLGIHQVPFGVLLTGWFFVVIALALLTMEKPNAIYMKNKLTRREQTTQMLLLVCLVITGFLGIHMNFQWNRLLNYDIIYVLSMVLGVCVGTLFWNRFPGKYMMRLCSLCDGLLFLYAKLPAAGVVAGSLFGVLCTCLMAAMLQLNGNRPGRTMGLCTGAIYLGMIPGILRLTLPCSDQIVGALGMLFIFIICLTPFFGFKNAN